MATDEDVSASWELSSHGPTTENNLQTDESHKRDDTTIAEDETQHRETKPQSLAAQLRSPVLTNSRIPATSKSAFKPVSQRRQSLDSVNLPRRDSFGVSNPRGAMTKELLTAQLKSFLVNDEPPTQVVQGNDQELGKTLTTGTGRKLPPSPDVNQGDILPNQSGAKLGQVPRRPNSTDSRHTRYDRTSPMRSHVAKPPPGTHSNNNNNSLVVNNNNMSNNNNNSANENNMSRTSPMQTTTRRSRSNSRIPTPSSLNTSAVVNNSGTTAAGTAGTANVSGNNLNQNGEGQNISNGHNAQTSGIPVLARRNSMGSYNGNGNNGATGAFSRIPTLAKRPSPSLSTTQPDEKNSQIKMEQNQKVSNTTKEAVNTSFSRRTDDKEKPKSAFTSVTPQNTPSTRPKSYEPDEVTTSSSINDPKVKRSSVIYVGESREPNTSRDDVIPKSFTSRIPIFQRTASARFESEQSTHKCERAPRSRNKLISESEVPNVSFSNEFTSSFASKKQTSQDYVTGNVRQGGYAKKKPANSDEIDYDDYTSELRSPRKIPNLVNFETKHADVLSEAFSIIGKYFPEKQAYAYNFQRTGNLGPKLRSRLQRYENGFASHNYFNRPLPVHHPHLMTTVNNYPTGPNYLDPNLVYYNPRVAVSTKRPQTAFPQQILQPTFVPLQQYGRPQLTYIPLSPYGF